MSEFIGLTKEELEQIQRDLKQNLSDQVQKLVQDIQEENMTENGLDLISVIASKDSIALQTSIEYTQKAIEANNRKIADLMSARDTLVLKTAIEFTERAIEANSKKIFQFIENRMKHI